MGYDVRTDGSTYQTWYVIGSCVDSPWSGGKIQTDYRYVNSMRRKKPGGSFIKPNNFEVMKFRILSERGDINCWTVGSTVATLSPYRAFAAQPLFKLPWVSFPSQPGDLCGFHRDATATAIRDVYEKANSPETFDLAPVLFELGETLAYIGNVIASLEKLVRILRSFGSIRNAYRSTRRTSLSAGWLEYRYAVMPLILTVSEAIQAFSGGTERKTWDARIVLKDVKNTYWYYWPWKAAAYARCDTIDQVSATARLYIASQCDPNPLGLGIMDVVRGVWEVVPLSFILDWFLGVGAWLTSLRNTNLELKASYVTTVVERIGYCYFDKYGGTMSNNYKHKFRHFHMKRQTDISPPLLPILEAEKLSVLRTLDSIALSIQLIKTILKS